MYNDLLEFHSRFPGGIPWRLTASGVELETSGLIAPGVPAIQRTASFIEKFSGNLARASADSGVPVELLLACALTESAATNPQTSVRKEPGYISDEATPHRISAGICQLLISTAREIIKDKSITRTWLFNVDNCLRACAAYIRTQSPQTLYDPVCVACAYNAGGLYEQKGPANRWRLRQYPIGTSKHADRFVEYFNAALALGSSFDGLPCVRYKSLFV